MEWILNMNWRVIYSDFTSLNKEACLKAALECCNIAATFTDNQYVLETIMDLKSGQNTKSRLTKICLIRSKEVTDLFKREAAHIVLHAIEVSLANNHISAAGHVARCIEALSRIEETLAQDVVINYIRKAV